MVQYRLGLITTLKRRFRVVSIVFALEIEVGTDQKIASLYY